MVFFVYSFLKIYCMFMLYAAHSKLFGLGSFIKLENKLLLWELIKVIKHSGLFSDNKINEKKTT